jgi:hypothetical protein
MQRQELAPVPQPRGPPEARLLDASNSPLYASVPVPVPAAEPVPMQRRMLAPASQPRGPEAHLRDASNSLPYAINIRVHNATADAHIKTSMRI